MLDSFLWLQVQQRLRHELPGYLGVIMLNIDRLGRLNDALGGKSSEDVVRAFSAVLGQATRESDFLVRYTGGTFCLAISHATHDSLALAGERLRAYIERHAIDLGEKGRWNVTASFGCAWLPDVHEPGDPVLGLLDAADAELQQAQAAGGNRVAVAAVATTSTTSPLSEVGLPGTPDDRIPTPLEVAELLDALPDEDRDAWATVFYAGLRPGELAALRAEDVDLDGGVLRVQRTWDRRKNAAKAKKRTRTVPIVAPLRPHLAARTLRRRATEGPFFGSSEQPLDRDALVHRAEEAWREAGLTPLGLEDGRDAFASLLIAARVNVQTISALLGHSSVQDTLDRYGHLVPGTEDETVLLVDAYLQRITTAHQRPQSPVVRAVAAGQ
jgi:diguanylate cyclase (GGDEF)-like protein